MGSGSAPQTRPQERGALPLRRERRVLQHARKYLVVARAVAEAVIRYRAEHKLTQTGLARLLGWSQPVVARLEAAEHNPTMDTLVALSRTLGLRVHVDVSRKTGVVAKVTKTRAA